MRGSMDKRTSESEATYFNSRLYMRGSRSYCSGWSGSSVFQFTPLHERQHNLAAGPFPIYNFNSRLYMRGSGNINKSFCRSAFQFTPLHERQRLFFNQIRYCFSISIHASTWEAARNASVQVKVQQFQFTPLHERQLQKYTIFSIKSTQFSTKPCFFIVTSRKVVFFSIPVQYFL